MNMHDFHIHTRFSFDSNIEGKDLCEKALELGYNEIAITEHVDLLPHELSHHGLSSLHKYQKYVYQLRDQFPALKLHCGVEIGDYHRIREYAAELIQGYNFYPILGSVHFTSCNINVAIPIPQPLSEAQVLDYYQQNLELVTNCDIDILAHLGVYKRYYDFYPDESFAENLIKEIFRVMIKRDIALEINFSSLFKPYKQSLPEHYYISLYKKMDGKYLSLGSDAHRLNSFGSTLLGAEYLDDFQLPPSRR